MVRWWLPWSSCIRSALRRRRSEQAPWVLMLADRGRMSKTASSPTNSPGPSSVTISSSRRIETQPSRIMKRSLLVSPSRHRYSLGPSSRLPVMAANLASSSAGISWNMGTRRKKEKTSPSGATTRCGRSVARLDDGVRICVEVCIGAGRLFVLVHCKNRGWLLGKKRTPLRFHRVRVRLVLFQEGLHVFQIVSTERVFHQTHSPYLLSKVTTRITRGSNTTCSGWGPSVPCVSLSKRCRSHKLLVWCFGRTQELPNLTILTRIVPRQTRKNRKLRHKSLDRGVDVLIRKVEDRTRGASHCHETIQRFRDVSRRCSEGFPEFGVVFRSCSEGFPEFGVVFRSCSEGLPRVRGGHPKLFGGLPRVRGGLPKLFGGLPRVRGGLPKVFGGLPRVRGGLPKLFGGLPRVRGGLPKLFGGLPRVRGGLPKLFGGLPRVRGGLPKLFGGLPRVRGGYPNYFGGPPPSSGRSP